MDNHFKDKTVIITGGSAGVGAATARKFADAGANLVLAARGKKVLERMAQELRARTRVETVTMDVSDTDACMNLFKKAEFAFGSVDVLVNNAGFHERGAAENITIADLGTMIDVNLVPWMRHSEDSDFWNGSRADSSRMLPAGPLAGVKLT